MSIRTLLRAAVLAASVASVPALAQSDGAALSGPGVGFRSPAWVGDGTILAPRAEAPAYNLDAGVTWGARSRVDLAPAGRTPLGGDARDWRSTAPRNEP